MRYITNQHPEAVGTWVLCEDGEIVERFGDGRFARTAAVRALCVADADHWRALVAAGEQLPAWESAPAIAFVGQPTSDRRQLEPGGESFRSFPQPLMLQTETAFGHDGAVIAGRIDHAEVQGEHVVARGVFDSGDTGAEAHRLVSNQMITGVSVDLGEIEVETEILAMDDDGWVTDWLDRFTSWEVMGATLTPWPAFADAAIKLAGEATEEDDAEAEDDEPAIAAAGGPAAPPVEWFADPQFDEPTAMVVTDDGQIYGHIATWGTCHIGRQGTCITPPRSATDYSLFTTGYVSCEDGCHIPTGVLSLGGGHADLRLNAREAAAHYDNSSTGVADVAVGEDDFGIWIAGAVRPGVTEEQVRELRASSPSGDWRALGGNLELVAVLAVNVPGYPVPRSRVASGEPQALVAAATPRPAEPVKPLAAGAEALRQLAEIKKVLRAAGVYDQATAALAARVRPPA